MPDEQVPPANGDPRAPWYGDASTPWQPLDDPTRSASGAAGWPPGSPSPNQPGSPWPNQGGSQWPSPGGWPWPQPQPQRRSRRWAVVTGAIVAAALISGSAGYALGVQHSRINAAVQNLNAVASGSCPGGTASPAASATSSAGTYLMARLLPIPTGDEQVTALKQGVLSLNDYMSELYSDEPAERAHLVAHCFLAAVHRTWTTPDGTTVSVWLIQFGSHADARSYTLATEQGDVSAVPAATAKFTVPGVGDSMGLADPTLDQDGNTFTRVLGDAGNTSIIIHLYIPAKVNNAASSQIIQAQNARLSGGSA